MFLSRKNGSAIMQRVTYYVVLPFYWTDEGIQEGRPFEVLSASIAKRYANMIDDIMVGVVVFSRTGDPTTGEWDDAIIILRAGRACEH